MAFQPANLTLWSAPPSPNAPRNLPQWWGYLTTIDNAATVSAAGYFNTLPESLILSNSFRIGDFIYCICSDAVVDLQITTLLPNILTIASSFIIPAGSVTTAELANLAVTAAKIANATITTTQISGTAAILGSQLSATAGIVGTQLANTTVTGSKLANNTVASGQLDLTTIQYVKVPVTAAQFNGMYAAPFVMIAAPGAGQEIVVKNAVLAMTFVAAQYVAGGAVGLQYDSTAHGAGPLASATVAAATVQGYAASSDVGVAGADTSGVSSAKVNKGLYLSNDTAAFTTGDGTWSVHIWYSIVTL